MKNRRTGVYLRGRWTKARLLLLLLIILLISFLFLWFPPPPQAYRVVCECDWGAELTEFPGRPVSNAAAPLSGCRGLSVQTGSPYPHTTPVHTKAHKLACVWQPPTPTPPRSPALPLHLALRCLLGCGTKLCCVSGGNASPLSTERLFDDGLLCTSLWFQNLQRAGLRTDL